MFANPYVKSVVWLVACGGLGYGLMLLTEPNAEKIERIKASSSIHTTAEDKKKALFMQKLKEAATTTPIYMPADKKE